MDSVTMEAPGKINLLLKIGDIRGDGKHNVLTVMSKTGISDTVVITKKDGGSEIVSDDVSLPTDEKNLALKAAKAYIERFSVKDGVKIELFKRIPVKAGMGGGSADAGAVLTGMKKLFGKGTEKELSAIASELGSDVPFFVFPDKVMMGKGSGDEMEPLDVKETEIYGVFLSLGKKQSTGEMYAMLDKKREGTGGRKLTGIEAEKLKKALRSGDFSEMIEAMENDFETVYGRKESDILLSNGAKKTLLCGSGPTVAGIFTSEKEAEEAVKRIGNNSFYCKIL